MIPHITRLLELWRIAAHYRLDTLFPAEELPVKARHALNIIKMHPAAWSSREKKNPLKLKEALEDMGPLAIKLGQLLSTRRDLIPPEVLSQLVLLQDRVKPYDTQLAKQRIQDSLKADISTLFLRFDEQPLAAASIAQVHTAALHDGREVIVKVTRPDIRSQILQDFEILAWLGDWLENRLEAARALHLSEIIQDYRQIILNELDLSLEADNTRRMRHYFTGSSMMYVPEVYMDSKDVMVAERITGVPISDTATFDRLGMDRADLAEKMQLLRSHGVIRDTNLMTQASEGGWYYQQVDLGFNYRMTELQAALGVSQMTLLDTFIARRHQLAKRYDELLKDLPIILPTRHPENGSALHLYPIQIKADSGKTRKQVFDHLRANDIGVNVHYIPVHTQPYYQAMGFATGDFPNSEAYYQAAISLPLYYDLTEAEQDTVVAVLTQAFMG